MVIVSLTVVPSCLVPVNVAVPAAGVCPPSSDVQTLTEKIWKPFVADAVRSELAANESSR
jgi:hypothetical protein